MVVGAARNDAVAAILNGLAHDLAVLDDLLGVALLLGEHPLAEDDGLRRDDVLERTALHAREYGGVESLGPLLLAENHAAARTAEGLMGRRGDEIGVRNGRGMGAARDETGDMGHVDEHDAACLVADLADALEVDRARIGRCARKKNLGLHFHRKLLDLIVVERLGLGINRIRDDVVYLAREVDGRAVRKVTALIERHRKNRVAGLDRREVNGHVGRRAAVGLDIGVIGAEKFARALAGELLGRVDGETAGIPALARIALGVLVHKYGAGRLAAGAGRCVLGGDEVDLGILLDRLGLDRGENLGVVAHKAGCVGEALGALELPAAAGVTLVLVDGRGEERLGDLNGVFDGNRVGAETKNVGAIVLTRESRGLGRGAESRADVLEAVGAHRHADTAAADENTEVGRAGRDLHRDLHGVVGIVAARLVGRP